MTRPSDLVPTIRCSALRAGALGLICQPTRHQLPCHKQQDKVMLSKGCPSDHNCTFLKVRTQTKLGNPGPIGHQTLVMTLGTLRGWSGRTYGLTVENRSVLVIFQFPHRL